jgi:ankyrin repeat protein
MTRRLILLISLGMLATLTACGFPPPDTPLTRAAQAGDVEQVRALITQGQNPDGKDSHGMTPLVRAARRGDTAVVRTLLEGHADPNLKDSPVTRPGWTPLMNAVHKNQLKVVRLLLAAGADANAAADNGTTPLMLASGDAGSEIVKALLEAGANPPPKRTQGPLMDFFDRLEARANVALSGTAGTRAGSVSKAGSAAAVPASRVEPGPKGSVPSKAATTAAERPKRS